MKTKTVAESAKEFMEMLPAPHRVGEVKPAHLATGTLVITESGFRFESKNGGVEGVSREEILGAIAKAVGLDAIKVEFPPRQRSAFEDVPVYVEIGARGTTAQDAWKAESRNGVMEVIGISEASMVLKSAGRSLHVKVDRETVHFVARYEDKDVAWPLKTVIGQLKNHDEDERMILERRLRDGLRLRCSTTLGDREWGCVETMIRTVHGI